MKAYKITSEEYYANEPSVFLFVNGEYYGCMIYPKLRKFPQDVNYWRTATSSDSDRNFHIEEVNVSEEEINSMKNKQSRIDELNEKLKPYTGYRAFATKEEREQDYQEDLKTEEYNRPIDREIYKISKEIHNIILNLQRCE